MTKEEIINTLSKLGIRTEDATGTLGIEIEPNGNKILYLGNIHIGTLFKDNNDYKIKIKTHISFDNTPTYKQLNTLVSITTCENMESIDTLEDIAEAYLNNLKTFLNYIAFPVFPAFKLLPQLRPTSLSSPSFGKM